MLLIPLLVLSILGDGTAAVVPRNLTEADDLQQTANDVASSLRSFDSMTSDVIRSVAKAAPTFSPVLTFSAVSYLAYVALAMSVPSTLRSLGLPVLEDFSMEARSMKKSSATSLDALTSIALKEIAARSKTADDLLSLGKIVMANGVSTVRSVTQMLSKHLNEFQGTMDTLVKGLKPGCIARYMCQAGQSTGRKFPTVGIFLRSIDSPYLDEFSRALIDGTTIGNCKAVFYDCDL